MDAMPALAASNLDRVSDRHPEEIYFRIVQRLATLGRSRDLHGNTLSTLPVDIINLKEPARSYANFLNVDLKG